MSFKEKLVIIPTYNESENIDRMIDKVMSLDGDFHLLIIDDGSPDGTAEKVKSKQEIYSDRLFLIQRPGKLGLGTAYITGFKWALEHNYKYVFEMDADFSHNPEDLIHLYNACANGADLAIGSRYVNGVNVVNWPIGRVLMSYFASKYVRWITGMKISDTTAGFKCYKADVLRSINFDKIKHIGYGFQIEMKFTVWKLGFNIVEVPIIFTDRKLGVSKMSGGIFNEALWGVVNMKLKSLFVSYKKLHQH
ncbi:MAG: dolichol-phosphate mannosyltransferase [Tenuifilum sp.]|jgi:dolichol-phosphate mannosyltransferase|uniref:polyprenol monophosphomannose synthase n=1 Tax=Tenuifilum sp. TaxID=2760880 RepID=UPI0024AC2ACC|nr:polyprenol monophosphomannose synthase [Tenuifilum sp.]MDI3527816.1 dolichol-phosphate mannosyltransferase [Tenuifilum sp.]